MQLLKTKAFWRKGGGEVIGFVYILPFIVLLICCVIASAQVGLVRERLSYTAYTACRAAVVSADENIARERGIAIFEDVFGDLGAAQNAGGGYDAFEITILDGNRWEKGSFVRVTVRYYMTTLMPFTSGVREESIVMMIENTAPSNVNEYVDGAN